MKNEVCGWGKVWQFKECKNMKEKNDKNGLDR